MRYIRAIILAALTAIFTISASAEILVGIAAPFSGPALPTGDQIEVGATKAIEELNANGGVLGQQITIETVDDACDGAQGAAAAKQLVAGGVVFVVGHACSGASIAGGPIYDKANIVMISPSSTNPKVTDSGLSRVFRVIGRDDDQGALAGDFLADRYGNSNIAILHDNSTFGKGLAEITKARLNELGIKESLFEIYSPAQTSYDDLVNKFIKSKIDAIYIGGYQGDAGIIIRQAKAQLPDIQLVGGDALASEDFPLIAGEAGIGTYFTFGPDARNSASAKSVVNAIREDEGIEPLGYVLYSYAAVQVWAQAVEKAGTTSGAAVSSALKEMQFQTVLGPVGFDAKGDVTGLVSFVWNQITEDGYSPVE